MESVECLGGWSRGGWGVFIALNHLNNRLGLGFMSMGAPDSPVHQPRHPAIRVRAVSTIGALSSGGIGQSSAAPDKHCLLSGAPLTSSLTSAANCSADRGTVQSTVALKSRCSTGAPDSPVNYSGATPEKPEGEEFGVVRSWCTGHCLVAHRTLSGGTPDSPVCQTRAHIGFFAPFFLNPFFNLFIGLC
jgi:hypothetical protein